MLPWQLSSMHRHTVCRSASAAKTCAPWRSVCSSSTPGTEVYDDPSWGNRGAEGVAPHRVNDLSALPSAISAIWSAWQSHVFTAVLRLTGASVSASSADAWRSNCAPVLALQIPGSHLDFTSRQSTRAERVAEPPEAAQPLGRAADGDLRLSALPIFVLEEIPCRKQTLSNRASQPTRLPATSSQRLLRP